MREFKGNSLIRNIEDYTVVDIETTSLDSRSGEILEISAIKVRNKEIVDTFSKLIKVSYVSAFTTHLTGITNTEMQEYGEDLIKVLEDFLSFLGDDIIVGHNVNFDVNFLYDNLERKLSIFLTNNYIDTLRLSRMYLPQLKHHRLDDLITYFNLEQRSEHRALNDCVLTNQVYLNLCKLENKVYDKIAKIIVDK